LGCFITLYTANTAVFYLISFAVILAAAYFKPFLPILSGFICGIFLVFFHYLVFYSQSECDLRPKKPVIANFQVISIHSAQSPFYVKASLKSIQGCSLSILKPPLAMISVSTAQKLTVGDEVSAQIKLKPFRSVKNYNSFDRERHAFRQRLFYKGRTVSKIQIENQTGKPTSTEVYRNYISTITTGSQLQWLYYALLTGDKSKISQQNKQQLRELGISHLLAISGLHIGLVYAIGFYFSKYITRIMRIPVSQTRQINSWFMLIGFCFAATYVYLSGFAVSAVRALLMLGCLLFIYILNKNPLRWRTILYALTLVLIIDPFTLLNPGLYFSFIAVAIIFLVIRSSLGKNLGFYRRVIQLGLIQLALFIGLLPLSLFYFDGVSTIGLLVNLVAVPIISVIVLPFLVLYSFLSLLLDLSLLLYGLDFVLNYLYQSIMLVPKQWRWLEFAFVEFNTLVLIYSTLLLFLCYPYRSFAIIPVLIVTFDWLLSPKSTFQLDVFDVGHGLMVMLSEENKAVVYDLGPRYFGRYDYIQSVLLANINALKLEVIATIVSHQDNDHIGGLHSWNENGFGATLKYFHPHGVNARCEPKLLKIGNVSLTSFSMPGDNNNDQSCILRVKSGEYSVLLTGDISAEAEQQLITRLPDLQATVLVSPHHGSNTSSSQAFIEQVRPKLVIHSSAYQGQWQFPHPEVVKRYQDRDIAQLSTADSGHIRIKFYNDTFLVESAREHESYWFEQD